jgi:hypothetical protein
VYYCFLVSELPVLLRHVPPHQQHVVQAWWGTFSFFCIVTKQQNQTFSEQWIGRGDPVN